VEAVYRSPFRVYLVLAVLSLIGLFCALKLPISLFPNSSKPIISLCINPDQAPEAFMRQYGSSIEEELRGINRGRLKVETVRATYSSGNACFESEFVWGADSEEAEREVRVLGDGFAARLTENVRNTMGVWNSRQDGGFLALSFYSSDRDLTDLYHAIEPVLAPKFTRVTEAAGVDIYNPQKREILIELRPEAMAALNLFPADISRAIMGSLDAYTGGSLTVGSKNIRVVLPRSVMKIEDLAMIQIPTASGRTVSLSEIAHIDLSVPVDSGRVFKTSGMPSVILWASPKPGGNIKAMAEGVRAIVDSTMASLPKDIGYKVLVDPSEFIRSAVSNVGREVALAAGLAVFILFLFVGNIKNVATAAIEIPISIVLAFILMRISNMNLNLISLGGLALSAGMNVDASVVVMENIFRHFEKAKGQSLTYEKRLKIISSAVNEVRFAVIASTIASLVVFIPLAFTSDLTYAVLGDLAKAVVFSHGFSAVVALVLVPTIRLHIMKDGFTHEKPSLLDGTLARLEKFYGLALAEFMKRPKLKISVYLALTMLIAILMSVVAPNLPREVIGKPDTDWLMLGIDVHGNTLMKQMESQTAQVESQLLTKYGDQILYTFSQINRPNGAFVMFRVKDKRKMESLLKETEQTFTNTPDISYWIDSWNPAELPIPNPPDLKVTVRGSDSNAMAELARDFTNELRDRKIFERVNVSPSPWLEDSILIRPKREQWSLLAKAGLSLDLADLADLTRTATEGRAVTTISLMDESGFVDSMKMRLRFPQDYVKNADEIGALPIGAGSRLVPLKALASVTVEEGHSDIRRENGREMFTLTARGDRGEEKKTKESVKRAEALIADWSKVVADRQAKKLAMASIGGAPAVVDKADAGSPKATLQLEDAKEELTTAIKQLAFAITLSIGLIFLTMVFQFGSIMNALLVLVAVPLGFVGVLISLYVFHSTLSLNSMLGVILLNGLSVANSIILVDFLQRKVKEGVAPRLAAVEVARVRLRPILMTSLTTLLGMLPVALGIGEGGKILQPLGIAVAGGLGFSMVMTLFIVPSLQVSWLEYKANSGAGVKHV
jgi:HAE1 family hydrophobic/amphiphilic exporter-1